MHLQITAYGIAKDILGNARLQIELPEAATVTHLKEALERQFPQLAELKSLAVAVNQEYAAADQRLSPADEIVLIPPVSGG